uniref:Uncharacterized protein n=1 Tax=Arundo donax TaxID=35708 RepID=A0A0A9F9D0_ARUDO
MFSLSHGTKLPLNTQKWGLVSTFSSPIESNKQINSPAINLNVNSF